MQGQEKTEIFVSETKNSRTVVYESETVHKVREFKVATKIFLFFNYNLNLLIISIQCHKYNK